MVVVVDLAADVGIAAMDVGACAMTQKDTRWRIPNIGALSCIAAGFCTAAIFDGWLVIVGLVLIWVGVASLNPPEPKGGAKK